MNWIKNIKITQKFLFLLIVTLLSLSTIGIISFMELKKMGNKLEDMYHNRLIPIETISTMKNNQQYVRLALIELMVNTEEARNEELLTAVETRIEQNQELMESYKSSNPNEIELLERNTELINEFLGIKDELLDLTLKNQNQEAYGLYVANLAPILNEVDDLYTELIQLNSNIAQTTNEENTDAIRSSIILLIGFITLALVLYIVISWTIVRFISNPIKEMEELIKEAENGNLTVQSNYESKDEIGSLAHSFNGMLNQLRSLIMQVRESSDQVAASSEQLMASAEETNNAAEHIAETSTLLASGAETSVKGTESVSISMQEMAMGINNIANSISLVHEHSNATTDESEKGNIALNKTINQMRSINETVLSSSNIIKELGNRSTEVEKIVAVISGISEQTNLLALNASIEAARAGEHGKGFAVVANEVKKLAEESRRSAEHITHLIHDIQRNTMDAVATMEDCTSEVKEGLELINLTGKSFSSILYSATDVSKQSQEVSAAAEQISASVEQMASNILGISKNAEEASFNSQNVAAGAEEQLASMEEITASANALAKMAEDLKNMVAIFKIS
ncbi:methyl-accepting chemotaxis protein [Bacillus sp. PS06]|uniref:methyl-accepting chemotaxis protein n=1 Tax=Bacillus sp. PS06 TaxID=2764176 RepID=UPI00177FAA1E|nr:HAMP domain-containing methyl-accepting chemotaxis protein [Bacillus sp. PS06]MBD8070724.1 methyl-accepting chemotaxis protein [Bacillus sp. PS06]